MSKSGLCLQPCLELSSETVDRVINLLNSVNLVSQYGTQLLDLLKTYFL